MKYFVTMAVLMACGGPGDDLPGIMFDPPTARAASVEATPATALTSTVVAAQVWALHDRLIDCVVKPADCEVHQVAAQGSAAHQDLDDFVQRRRLDGLEARPVSLPPVRHIERTWPTTDSVHVELCWVDDLVLMTPAAALGQPVILDDSALTLGETWSLTTIDDAWRLDERRITRTEPGRASWCR